MSDTAMRCPYCGEDHGGLLCPQASAIEYHPNGVVKRVEFRGVALRGAPARFAAGAASQGPIAQIRAQLRGGGGQPPARPEPPGRRR